MQIKHRISRSLLWHWPTETGFWRVLSYAPVFARDETAISVNLRNCPLSIWIKPNTYLGRHIFYRGIYEEHQLSLLKKVLCANSIFLDIGANVGLWSLVAGHQIGINGRVIAVEPQLDLVNLFRRSIEENGLHNIRVIPIALGASPCMGSLHQVSTTNDGAATLKIMEGEQDFGNPVIVEIVTLSSLLEKLEVPRVDVMKIDVEGGELDVLLGFSEWLIKRPPKFIFFECIDRHLNRFGASAADLLSYLWKHDYSIRCLYRGKWFKIESYDAYERYKTTPDLVAYRTDCISDSLFD